MAKHKHHKEEAIKEPEAHKEMKKEHHKKEHKHHKGKK
jgi:hypothetical protein